MFCLSSDIAGCILLQISSIVLKKKKKEKSRIWNGKSNLFRVLWVYRRKTAECHEFLWLKSGLYFFNAKKGMSLPLSLLNIQLSWFNAPWWLTHRVTIFYSNNSFQIKPDKDRCFMYKVYLAMTAPTFEIWGAMKHYHWFHVLRLDNDTFPGRRDMRW